MKSISFLFAALIPLIGLGEVIGPIRSGQFQVYENRNAALTAMARIGPIKTLAGLTGISGVTYNARSGTVFLIKNAAGAAGNIYEATITGEVIRTITNSNFVDTEAIAWVGYDAAVAADVFVIGEEDPNERLTLCRLTPAATTLDRTAAGNVSATTGYSGGSVANLGLESVCFDAKRNRIYYTIEKREGATQNSQGTTTARIYTRSVVAAGTMSFGTESVLCTINALFTGAVLTDIGDMCFDANQDNIILASHESVKLVRVNRSNGTLIEQIPITGFTQAEGVGIHPNGTQIFVSGEVNEFARFEVGWHVQSANTINPVFDKTITPPGTTGAQTINFPTGRVNFASGATSLVVTNDLVKASSIITTTKHTNDGTARLGAAVAGVGSFTIFMDVAPGAECAVNFRVSN